MATGKRSKSVGKAGVRASQPGVGPLASARQPASGRIPSPPPYRVPGSPPATVRAPTPNPTGLVPVVPALRSEQVPSPRPKALPVPSVYPDARQISASVLPVAVPVAAPSLDATVPQSPLETSGPPLVGEYGTQDSLFGPGYTFSYYGERYTSDMLARNRGWNIYELMLRDDQITASLVLLHSFITARAWTFEVDDADVQGEASELLQFNFSRALHGTIRQLLEQLLTARIWGFAMVEKIIEVLPWEGRQWYMLAAYKLRPAWTFTFQTDRNGNTLSAVQQQYAQRLQVPPEKFIQATYQPHYDAQYGRSVLIPVYDLWWQKKNIRKFWDIWLERAAAGFMVGEMPSGTTPADRQTLLNGINNMSAASAFLMPPGGKAQYVSVPHTSAFSEAIQQVDQAIARALLLPSHIGLSDQGSTGSRAQGASQLSTFQNVVDSESAWVEDIINEQLVAPLVLWNFGPDVPAPLFRFVRETAQRKMEMAKAVTDAIATGVVVRTDEDEAFVREKLGMPPRDYDEAPDVVPEPGEKPEDALARASEQAEHAGMTPGQIAKEEAGEPESERHAEGDEPKEPGEISAEGGMDMPDENDPSMGGGGSGQGKNILAGLVRHRSLSVRDVMARLDVPASVALLTRQDDALAGVLRRVAGETFGALAGQIKKTSDASLTKTLEIPKAVRAQAHKEIVSALQTTYDHAASQAELDIRRMGYKGASPGAAKGAPGARGKHKLALDETTAAAWLEAHADELLTKLTEDQRKAFVQAWLNGIQNDWSEGEIIDSVKTALGGAVSDAWVDTAVRTIDSSAFNAGRRAVFEDPDLEGWVVGYEYSAILDEHTTELCETMGTMEGGGGARFPVDSPVWDRLMPPNHFNCRSTVIPLTKDDGLIEWTDETAADGLDAQKGF